MPIETEPASGSFDALYRESAADLYAYVFTLVRDRQTAEDVSHAAFERAYRKRSSYKPRKGTQRAWLFGIARNAALDELRRRKRGAALIGDPPDPATPDPGDGDDALRRSALRAALTGLDARDRELIALKFYAELSNEEIARVLGISTSNAGTRVHRAIQRLREACNA